MNRNCSISSASDPIIIEFKNVSFRYLDQADYFLDNINLRIDVGEWIAVMGRNGSGKSTLAKLMNGLLIPSAGNVRVADMDTRDDGAHRFIPTMVGLVFQNPDDQMIGLTVEDDISFGLLQLDISEQETGARVNTALTDFGLTGLAGRPLRELSGGEKQRVAVAGIFAMRPRVIVLDESTSMLSPYDSEEIMTHIRRIHEQGITVIHITNNPEDVWKSQRLIIFHEQKIIYDGAIDTLFPLTDALDQAGLLPPFLLRMQARLHQEWRSLPNLLRTEDELAEVLWTYASIM